LGRRVLSLKSLSFLTLIFFLSASFTHAATKTFVYHLNGEPDFLDPIKSTTVRSDHVYWFILEALVVLSKDGKGVEPGLAERWDVGADRLTYTFHLRKGVQFHDGTPFNAESVKISIERIFNSSSPYYTTEPKNSFERFYAELIHGVKVVDDFTVEVKLRNPDFLRFASLYIVSPSALKKMGKDFVKHPIGTGPFTFETWSKGEIVLSANPHYWRGRPGVEKVIYRIIPNASDAVEGLLKGEIDYNWNIEPQYYERISESPHLRLFPVSALNTYYLGFYTHKGFSRVAAARRAMAHAINVPRMVLFLGRGGALPAHGLIPPSAAGYRSDIRQPEYDIARAREILRRGGLEKGGPLTLLYTDSVTFVSEVAHAIQSDLRKVGIEVTLKGYPEWRDVVESVRRQEGDMFIYNWSVAAPDPGRFLYPLFHSEAIGRTNFFSYANPEVDRLLSEARKPMEESKRLRLLQEAERIIVRDVPAVFLFHQVRMAAANKRVKNLEINIYSRPQDKFLTVDLEP